MPTITQDTVTSVHSNNKLTWWNGQSLHMRTLMMQTTSWVTEKVVVIVTDWFVQYVLPLCVFVLQQTRTTMTNFLDIIHHPTFIQNVLETGLCLHPQAKKNLLIWAQSIELVPISRHENQNKKWYINQTWYILSAGVKTKVKDTTCMRPCT
jgi:hypothetical protein